VSSATAAAVEYPCEACGASVAYEPGTTALRCGYCGHTQAIPEATRRVMEHGFGELGARPRTPVAALGPQELVCPRCGATSASTNLARQCPFCGAPLVVNATRTGEVAPEAVVPFGISAADARTALLTWTRSRWFAPRALRSVGAAESVRGTYVPHWTFDADTLTDYRGQRGEHYWVTVSSTDSEGRTQTHQEQRTRWHRAAGTVQRLFDDVLIVGSRALPARLLERLRPWPLADAVPFSTDYLAGHDALRYDVEPEEALAEAKAAMEPQIRSDVRRDIGGDEQRISSMSTQYRDLTYKLVLLPVWLAVYVYAGRTFDVAINARTGEVLGQRPYSVAKIVAAVLVGLVVVAAVVLAVLYVRTGSVLPTGP
jgi:DNA-directed RNA polymerase subunit RPC12/RpoP